MSEPTATLPSEVIAPPMPPAPAPVTEVTPESTSTKPSLTPTTAPPIVPSQKKEVPHDWKPSSIEDALADKLGEVVRKPDPSAKAPEPEAPKAEPTPAEAPKAADTDDEIQKEIDGLKFNSEADRKAFTRKSYELRDLRRKARELEAKAQEAETLRAKVAELEARPAAPASDEYKAKYEEADRLLAIADFKKSSLYQERVGAPMAGIEKVVSDIATRYSIDPRVALDALRDTSDARASKLSDLVTDMKEFDKTRLFTAAADYESFAQEEAGLLAKAKEYADSVASQTQAERAREEAARKQEWEAALAPAWDKVAKTADLAEIEGNEDYNAKLRAARAFASTYSFDQLDTPSRAEAMHRAAAFPFVLGKVEALKAQVAARDAELAKYRSTQPSEGRTTQPTVEAGKRDGFTEAVDRALRAKGLA